MAGHLTWNLTVHSLLLHDDTRRRRSINAVVSYWKANQVIVVQFEKLLLQHTEKHSMEVRWLQIQGFVERLVALLKRFKREQCAFDDFPFYKRKPDDNEPGIFGFNSILKPSKTMLKRRKHRKLPVKTFKGTLPFLN